MAARHVLDLAAAAQLAAAATTERAIASLLQPYRPAPHPDADPIAAKLAGRIAAEPGGPPVPAGGVTWRALWRWWADLPADAADPLADALDTAIMDLVGGPDSNLPDDPAERALWQMTLDLASPEIALILARHLDTWLWPDTPPELPETWAADLNTATIAAVALDASVRHPLRPLIRAYLDAHRPAAKPDRWPRATMPRLVTAERAGASARIEVARDAADRPAALTIPGLGSLDLPAVPGLAYLPGLAPPNATPAGVVPAAWLAIIDGMAATHSDAREWQRALRLLIEIVSAPDPPPAARPSPRGPAGRWIGRDHSAALADRPARAAALPRAAAGARTRGVGRPAGQRWPRLPTGPTGPLAAARRAALQRDVPDGGRRRRRL